MAIRQSTQNCSDLLFLDVYTTSIRAISLYGKHRFVKIDDSAIFDDIENSYYYVMALRVRLIPLPKKGLPGVAAPLAKLPGARRHTWGVFRPKGICQVPSIPTDSG